MSAWTDAMSMVGFSAGAGVALSGLCKLFDKDVFGLVLEELSYLYFEDSLPSTPISLSFSPSDLLQYFLRVVRVTLSAYVVQLWNY